ncbi:Six-hairpin glycosidase-like protein [Oleiagrimonas sp. C23AA]|nr:Six-hairpin glycosidase-like protein [Oleiagrimonas sp. C23AA]
MGPAAAGAAAPGHWQRQLSWQNRQATMQHAGTGYLLSHPGGNRQIAAGAAQAHTASTLFDGLFAMAQDDLRQDSVQAIRDGAFDHDKAIDCHCFETGANWHYVWTRDLSYSVDLGLWRFDPDRARASMRFKLSKVRNPKMPQGLYPMQDTGSGGSWPISTDRIVWFLGARHLLDDKAFAAEVYQALGDTLKQDRQYIYDARLGLYRGETSFLDWRQQTYPAWTANNVTFIAQSFALSTNVLHYQAMKLAARLARQHGDQAAATRYTQHAEALKQAINTRFWRADRDMYMSYIGGNGAPYEAYDLLGLSLAITSGVADPARARASLAHYPTWAAGSPVIWPERKDQPIYHNRAIWPFVSAYELRAARKVDDAPRIAHALRSIMRGAALAGSNMENFSLLAQSTHVDEGKLSGPVIDSPRQLWSVAGYLNMVIEGVFGVTDDGAVKPKIPASLVPMLFGQHDSIRLVLPGRTITLHKPAKLSGDLLVAGKVSTQGQTTDVTLRGIDTHSPALPQGAPMYAPATPPAPTMTRADSGWQVQAPKADTLYVDGVARKLHGHALELPAQAAPPCVSATTHDASGVESLHSPRACAGTPAAVSGTWPRTWKAPATGTYRVWLRYDNDHGSIETGITAAVRQLHAQCGSAGQSATVVMPQSVGENDSTYALIHARAGERCTFTLEPGFNMSDLANFAHYTGGQGGSQGPLNQADIGALKIERANGTEGRE